MMERLTTVRYWLLLAAWFCAFAQVASFGAVEAVGDAGFALFAVYLVLTLPFLRRDSFLLIGFIALLGAFLIREIPDLETIRGAGRFVLIFAGLVPTMALVKATALTMPSVRASQRALAELPPKGSSAGLQLAGHAFGGVINTGTFAMLSAALPEDSPFQRRRIAAMAALRGMNSSAMWSPFFVAFAIGQGFNGAEAAWSAIGYGALIALLFTAATLPVFTPGLTPAVVRLSLACLAPVASRLLAVLVAVLGAAIAFGMTALSAVVAVMPALVAVQALRRPEHIRRIAADTRDSIRSMADDLAVISAAMILGYLVTRTGAVSIIMEFLPTDTFPGWFALIATPLVMTAGSVIGLHPVITATVMLSLFSGDGSTAAPALLMQSHLVGWAAGTMSSIASLSVNTCTSLYRVSGRDLAMGANLVAALLLALGGGALLALVDAVFH